MTTKTAPRSKSPKGCNIPLMTHLTPQERGQLVELAEEESRSMSAMARLLIVQGLQRKAESRA